MISDKNVAFFISHASTREKSCLVFDTDWTLGRREGRGEWFHIVLRRCETSPACLSCFADSTTEAISFALHSVLHRFKAM